MSAAKTGFTSKRQLLDFQYKKENLLNLVKEAENAKTYKARTKGKFNEHVA